MPTSAPKRPNDETYSDLLNPTKDVEKNWEINIVTSLENYLAQMDVTVNLNLCTLNFAKAGLVIQGSAHVFGRKVDYLYNLVYHTYRNAQLIRKDKAKQVAQDKNQKPNAEFAFINFEQDSASDMGFESHRMGKKYQDFMPLSLIPGEDCDKADIFLHTTKGQEIGNCMDFRAFSLHRDQIGVALTSLPAYNNSPLRKEYAEKIHENGPGSCNGSIIDDFNDAEPFDDSPIPEMPASPIVEENIAVQRQAPKQTNILGAEDFPQIFISKEKVATAPKPKFVTLDVFSEDGNKPCPVNSKVQMDIPAIFTAKTKPMRKRRSEEESESDDMQGIWDFCDVFYYFGDLEFKPSSQTCKMLNRVLVEEKKRRRHTLAERKTLQCKQKPNHQNENIHEASDSDDEAGNDCVPSDNEEDQGVNGDNIPTENFAQEFWDDMGNHENGSLMSEDIHVVCYEELAKEHLAQYRASAQQFVKTTEMNKRVDDWRNQIMPLLDEIEQREPFDINVYAARLLDSFENNNRKQTLPFSKVVSGRVKWDASRYFLTSLLLTNQGNLEISANGVLEKGMDTMEVTLLSRKRITEDLNAYCNAP